ncbi:MAG TPA: lipocalin-like domain-containing protein [Gammaproteobacteria bacterium]|nr:lipocalin-like domain-containing protein [Gammaproteobacteria bacterium]
MKRFAIAALFVVALAAIAYGLWPRSQQQAGGGFSVQGLLGGNLQGYARADAVRPFSFPADHAAHPDYRSEWWYLTGNLQADDGRRYGFQFTIFRLALAPEPRVGTSAWGTRQAYMGHFAITDISAGRIHAFERFSRGALGLAGAEAEPVVRIWLDDWQLAAAQGDSFPWLLQAAEGDTALQLRLTPRKPLVLQGEQGLSRKGPEPGNASYYYSYTRLAADGELSLGGQRLKVTGSAWLDREWSTSLLSPEVRGWDWFSLQLEDGSELMLYRLRTASGIVEAFGAGIYVPADGPPQRLSGQDFLLEPTAHWTSPHTKTRYPTGWRARVPALGAELAITAATADQELDLSVRYWEGAVDVAGRLGKQPVKGVGYMELTGYGSGSRPPGR